MLLHNVMAVFTFVGGTMVRQDDTYSFSMIYRTLETVIPALLAVSLNFDNYFVAAIVVDAEGSGSCYVSLVLCG